MKRGKYRRRQGRLTAAQETEVWARRAAGESGTRIARHMGLYADSVRACIRRGGGVRPRPRKRSRTAVNMAEREEISRGMAAGDSKRAIAVRIGRSPSTVSREVARNGGRENYRAGSAEQAALNRTRRPKLTKFST